MTTQSTGTLSGTDAIKAATDAFKSGKDLGQAVYGTSLPSKLEDDSSDVAYAHEASDNYPLNEDVSGEAQESEQAPQEEVKLDAKTSGDIEEIILTDENGKRKLTVDFSDREKLKKYVQMAAGARKWQSERDKFRGELDTVKKEADELRTVWSAVEKAFKSTGPEGVLKLLMGDEKTYSEYENSRYQRRRQKEDASPSELERIELEERYETERRGREQAERERNEFVDSIKKDKETAEYKSLESMVNPVFDKYRFAGKLGDSAREERLDRMIWKETLDRISEMPDEAITQQAIDKEFRTTASFLRKTIADEANTSAKKVIDSKKAAAAENAATKSVQGMKRTAAQEEAITQLRKGNFGDVLRNVLTGKVRL